MKTENSTYQATPLERKTVIMIQIDDLSEWLCSHATLWLNKGCVLVVFNRKYIEPG